MRFKAILEYLACLVNGHDKRVSRRLDDNMRKVTCNRCRRSWGMHIPTSSFIPWDSKLDALYTKGGVLGPKTDVGKQS